MTDEPHMPCPSCGHSPVRVIDSRWSPGGAYLRRRRFCPNCSVRWTTHEVIAEREETIAMVINGVSVGTVVKKIRASSDRRKPRLVAA